MLIFRGPRFNGKGTAAPNRGVPFCLHRDLPGGRIGAPANAPAGMGSPNAWYQGWGSPPRPTAGEKVSSRCGARRGASRRGAETTAGVALSPGPQSAYGVAALLPGSGNRLLSGGVNGGKAAVRCAGLAIIQASCGCQAQLSWEFYGHPIRRTNAKRQNTGRCDAVGTRHVPWQVEVGQGVTHQIHRLREGLRASSQERSRAHPSSPCAAARYARSVVDADPCMRGQPDPGVHAEVPAKFMREPW